VLAAAGRRTSGTIALNGAEEYWPAVGSWSEAGDRIFAHGLQAPWRRGRPERLKRRRAGPAGAAAPRAPSPVR
jgi:hypothetical protein